jgi:hypothetical protein
MVREGREGLSASHFSAFLALLQRSEQYFTSVQTLAHFFRQIISNPQRWQVLRGRSDFLIFFGIYLLPNVHFNFARALH